jgi:hypothetical protein
MSGLFPRDLLLAVKINTYIDLFPRLPGRYLDQFRYKWLNAIPDI